MFTAIPFLGVIIAAYVLTAFFSGIFGGTPGAMDTFLQRGLFGLTLPSAETWQFRVADLFITLGLLALAIESIKSARTNRLSITNHGLSLLVVTIVTARRDIGVEPGAFHPGDR